MPSVQMHGTDTPKSRPTAGNCSIRCTPSCSKTVPSCSLVQSRDDRNRIKFRRNFRFRPVLPGFGFVRPFFAHFCPFLPIFCPNSPKFARFLPGFAPVSPKFARIRIRSFFAQILQDSFGFVRRPESGFGQAWSVQLGR